MAETIDAIKARLASLRGRLALAKAKKIMGGYNRWPAGNPKGGQFAPKAGGGAGAGAPTGNSFHEIGGPGWGHYEKPKGPPPGSKPHPAGVNDKGQPVHINAPTKASHPGTWKSPKSTATFVPGGDAPKQLNGVEMKSWSPPKDGWGKVTGNNEALENDFPFKATQGKSVGAGVLIVEPDGRLWLTKPTNEFGGYKQTYPKGTVESGMTMQQNAIKEAWEETGLKIKITGVLGDYERTTSRARMYIARRVGGTPKDMGWESQAVRLATLKDAKSLLNMSHDKQILDDLEELMSFGKSKGGKGGAWERQARWKAGSPLGGQWKAMGADGLTLPPKIAGGLEGKNAIYQKSVNAAHAAAQGGDKSVALALLDKYSAKGLQYASGVKTSSHVKWGAQVHQYAGQLVADTEGKTKATASADAINGPEKLFSMMKVAAKPGGSNPGAIYTDKDGVQWLVKGNKQFQDGKVTAQQNDDRAKNEVLASKLMQAAGVGAPDMKIVDLEGQHGGGLGVASKMIDGGQSMKGGPTAAQTKLAQQDFAVHAWLANYDVLGQGFDNTITKDGKAINIDPGGALLFRAQGLPKAAEHGVKNGVLDPTAPEFESMRKTTGEQVAVFGKMTQAQLLNSAEKLATVSNDTIIKLVNTYGPGDQIQKTALAANLIARRDAILEKVGMPKGGNVGVAKPPATPKVEQAATQAAAETARSTKKISAGLITAAGKAADAAAGLDADKFGAAIKEMAPHVTKAPEQPKLSAEPNLAHMALEKATKALLAGDKMTLIATGLATGDLASLAGKESIKKDALKVSAFAALGAAHLQHQEDKAAAKIADAAPKVNIPDKPVFQSSFKSADAYYNKLADTFQKLHETGDLAGLKAAGTTGKYDTPDGGKAPWKVNADGSMTANATKLSAYHSSLLADLQTKSAANVVASAQAADKALSQPKAPDPAGPAMPNFAAFKIVSGTNAATNNAKVDQIETLAKAGDVKGLLSLSYGTNTYGKKHAALANDVLIALGQTHTVTPGQKKNSHPALFGGVPMTEAAAASAVVKTPMPKPHPAPKPTVNPDLLPAQPTFITSNAAVKVENEGHAASLHALAKNGDLAGLKSYDAFSQKSQKLTAFKQELIENLESQLFPPRPKTGVHKAPPIKPAATPLKALSEHAQHFQPVKVTEAHKVEAHHKVAGWVMLGKTDPATVKQAFANGWSGEALPKSLVEQHTAIAQSVTPKQRDDIKKYVSNWSYGANDQMRNKGKLSEEIRSVSKSIHEVAVELPAGTVLKRNMTLEGAGLKALLAAQPGDIIQSPQFESTANPNGTYGDYKNVRLNLITAPGVKGIYIGEKLGLGSENEMLMPENTRYAIHRVYKQGGKTIVEAIVLPTVRGRLE